MARKLKTLYQVCVSEQSGWDTLHDDLDDAVKEARKWLDGSTGQNVLHIVQLKEVKQVARKSKR